ncbi:MAG TPA: hypothetical protein VIH70_13510 [Actinomycetota bacterium]|jgi:hypothetical protein
MFVRYYLDLPIALEDAEASLLDDPGTWVPGMLEAAENRGEGLLVEVGFALDTRRIDKEIEIALAEPNRLTSKTMLPMTWRATGPERLFPQLDADLEVASLGPRRTQLSISARYRPPLGAFGRALDRAMLHRVAEATIKDFLDRVGERVRARVPSIG